MKRWHPSRFEVLFTSMLLSLLLIHSETLVVSADSLNEGVFALDSEPYGMTYEEWTIKFWQWVLPIPLERNPVADLTGEHCGENQGDLPVFFLAFTGGGQAERTCSIPAGKAILVPVNVVEFSFLEIPDATEEDLHRAVEEDESSNPVAFLSVDGRELKEVLKYRVHSQAFDVTFAKDGIFGTSGGPTRAASDGYWIILEPLSAGTHELHFKALLTNPKTGVLIYSDDVKYRLNVAENGESSFVLRGTSSSGNYDVAVNWTSADIGSENTFLITVMTPSGEVLGDASYDVMLFKGNEHLDETHRSDQKDMEQKYTFNEPGSYTLRIENINGSGETDSITFPMQVTPEFPAGLSILFAVVVAAISLAIGKSRRI